MARTTLPGSALRAPMKSVAAIVPGRRRRAASTAVSRSAESWKRFYRWHAGIPLAAALLLFGLFEHTNLDVRLSDLFFDPATHQFPLRYDWFLEVVAHHWTKYLLVMIALTVLAGFALSFLLNDLRAHRRALAFVFLTMALGPAAVGALKDFSNKHCPYDLQVYGGYAPYRHLLQAPAPDIQPGRCWPAGHASGGFGLLAFYFLWRRSHPRRARVALAIALGAGLVLGLGRMAQGAHFLSHTLWSAVVCWMTALLLYELLLRRKVEDGRSQ